MATYLIDYENVYIEGLTGLERLSQRDEVVIFYTQNRCGLTFELHQRLTSTSPDTRWVGDEDRMVPVSRSRAASSSYSRS